MRLNLIAEASPTIRSDVTEFSLFPTIVSPSHALSYSLTAKCSGFFKVIVRCCFELWSTINLLIFSRHGELLYKRVSVFLLYCTQQRECKKFFQSSWRCKYFMENVCNDLELELWYIENQSNYNSVGNVGNFFFLKESNTSNKFVRFVKGSQNNCHSCMICNVYNSVKVWIIFWRMY